MGPRGLHGDSAEGATLNSRGRQAVDQGCKLAEARGAGIDWSRSLEYPHLGRSKMKSWTVTTV